MNKRQRKKLKNKLLIAIEELNNKVAKEEGFPPITKEKILSTYLKIKKSKEAINRTLKDFKRFILNKR